MCHSELVLGEHLVLCGPCGCPGHREKEEGALGEGGGRGGGRLGAGWGADPHTLVHTLS